MLPSPTGESEDSPAPATHLRPRIKGTTDNERDSFVIDRATNTFNVTLSDLFMLSMFRCYDSWQS
ncbi:hypothetical protein FRC20_007942, partial [Serendipita sp. 405]